MLHEIYRNYEVWTIDVEFTTPKDVSPVPYILTVRNAKTDEIIVSSAVDYSSVLLDDMDIQLED